MQTLDQQLSAGMNAVAENLIRKHKLRNAQGIVVCWNCHGKVALMPSLHCQGCLDEHRRRKGGVSAEDDGRDPTESRYP